MANCNKNQSGNGSQFNIFESGQAMNFPNIFETIAVGETIGSDPEINQNLLLESGQYKVAFKTDITDEEQREPFTLKNFDLDVPVENEFKRVRIFKMDSIPLSSDERKVVVKFALIDNPVWLAPILWTLPAIGSWFVVDKVESFAESSPVNFGLITLSALSALAFFIFK